MQSDNDIESYKSTLISRNITVLNHRTSVRLEPEMWRALKEISRRENCTVHDLCSLISLRKNTRTSLTAAIRVFVMLYFKAAATEEGHVRAAHGSFEHMKRRAGVHDDIRNMNGNAKRHEGDNDETDSVPLNPGVYKTVEKMENRSALNFAPSPGIFFGDPE